MVTREKFCQPDFFSAETKQLAYNSNQELLLFWNCPFYELHVTHKTLSKFHREPVIISEILTSWLEALKLYHSNGQLDAAIELDRSGTAPPSR